MQVFSNHHRQYGECTVEDWMDSIEGRNPSLQVLVRFKEFRQSVPIVYLFKVITLEEYALLDNPVFLYQTKVENGMYSTFWKCKEEKYMVKNIPLTIKY